MSTISYAVPRVTMDPSVYLRSTWRDAKGKLLTNHRITHYARLGRYGKEMQLRVSGRLSIRPCARCGNKCASFLRFSYLPHAMWCCSACRAHYQFEHEKAEQVAKALRERVREANKAVKAEKEARRALRRQQLEQVFE